MMATPRMTCGQNISSKSASAALERAASPGRAQTAQSPAADNQRGSNRLSRWPATGAVSKLRDAGDQHDGADLESVVTADIGEKHRHQIDRAEQSDPEAEAQRAADRERARAQRRQLDHGMRGLERSDREKPVADERRSAGTARRSAAKASRLAAPVSGRSRGLQARSPSAPAKSRRASRDRRSRALSRGSRNGVAAAAITPGATLIRNSQCQDQVSVIQPPTTGPTVGASTAMMPAMVVASGCRRSGNSRKTAENTAGISVPPAKPCSTRKPISVDKARR